MVHGCRNIAGVAAILLVFAGFVGIALRGPRPDPYQAHQDRRNSMKLVVQQALAACIATPVLITASLTIKPFDPDPVASVIASLFCQGVALAVLCPVTAIAWTRSTSMSTDGILKT